MGKDKKYKEEKVLLLLLPFWDPQIPPLGIACIKSYLRQRGCNLKTVDANVETDFREVYYGYFDILKRYIPRGKTANVYNIGNEVLRNHLMAHLNYEDEARYLELVRILVFLTFYHTLDHNQIYELIELIASYYSRLEQYLLDLLADERPATLGLSVYNGTLPSSLLAFKLAKKHHPQLKTIMGGGIFADQLVAGSPNLEFFMKKTEAYIDEIIVGEGEYLLFESLKGRLDGSRRLFTRLNTHVETVDLTAVDSPDFRDFKLEYYPHLAAYGSRSCPFQCSFCSETVNWGRYRKKPMGKFVEELIELYERHGYQLFLLTDSLLNPIVGQLATEVFKSGIPLYWDGFLRADKPVCDVENTLLWRRGGFYRAKLGLESGSPRVLEMMGKRITLDQIKEAVFSLANAGIKTTTFWVIGHPEEAEEDFLQTLNLIKEIKDNIYEADCNPFYYYLSGQSHSDRWAHKYRSALLYPDWAKEMLITQTWYLDCRPTRKVVYQRLNRFVDHCRKLGIPNPYTLDDIAAADRRWTGLHKNAVPPLVDFINRESRVVETREIRNLNFALNPIHDDNEWI